MSVTLRPGDRVAFGPTARPLTGAVTIVVATARAPSDLR
jgi:hypothetical protein